MALLPSCSRALLQAHPHFLGCCVMELQEQALHFLQQVLHSINAKQSCSVVERVFEARWTQKWHPAQ